MNAQAPQYDELAACLATYDGEIEAAECHGIVCGLLSYHHEIDDSDWSRRILSGELDAAPGEFEGLSTIHTQDIEILKNLIADSVKQLNDPELSFMPLLPSDDDSMEERSAALGEWCQGYLYGLTLAGVKEFTSLPEQAQEFAKDLIDISQLEINPDETEENEKAFFEVMEYVRLGALMMRDEMSATKQNDSKPKPTIH